MGKTFFRSIIKNAGIAFPLLIALAIPAAAKAENTQSSNYIEGDVYYIVQDVPDKTKSEAWESRNETIKKVVVGPEVTSLGNYAFYAYTGITEIDMSNATGLRRIGDSAFYNAGNLDELELPAGITEIGSWCFYNTNVLKIICMATEVPQMDSPGGTQTGRIIYVPDESVDAYRANSNWTDLGTIKPLSACPYEYDGLYYLLNREAKTAAVTKDADFYPVENITVPARISIKGVGYDVTAVGDEAFYACKTVKTISLPESITKIGHKAFSYCEGLTALELPANVKEIGVSAFSYASQLQSVNIPEGVATIGANTFMSCSSLLSMTLPSTVTTIGSDAFSYCKGLKEMVFPAALTTIGSKAFYNATGLTSIYLGKNITKIGYSAFKGCSEITKITIDALTPPSIYPVTDTNNTSLPTPVYNYKVYVPADAYDTYMADENWSKFQIRTPALNIGGICYKLNKTDQTATVIFNEEEGYKGDIIIPRTIKVDDTYYRVTTIGEDAFVNCQFVTSIDFSNITIIENGAFQGTAITHADFSKVASLGDMVCAGCISLSSVMLPSSLTRIPNMMFYKCVSLKEITIPELVTEIGNEAFMGAGLTTVTIPARVRTLGGVSFAGCENLMAVYLPTSLRTIGEYAFDGDTELKNINWYDSEAYEDGADKSGVRHRNVSSRAAAIDLTYHLTTMGSGAFSRTGLTYIYIPSTVEKEGLSIGYNCFGGTAIARVDVDATDIPSLDTFGFDEETYNTALIFVPDEALEAYKADKVWGKFKGYPSDNSSQMYVFADEAETTVYYAGEQSGTANGAFKVPDKVTDGDNTYAVVAVSASALSGTDVTSVELPASVISYGNSAFENCGQLESVSFRAQDAARIVSRVLKSQIRRFSEKEGEEEKALTSALGKNAFYGCKNLKSVELPDGIIEIPVNAFRGCESLTSLDIPSGITSIGEGAFQGSGLQSVTFPEAVQEVSPRVFRSCTNLSSVTLSPQTAMIGAQAFMGCTSLKSIDLPATLSYVDAEAFANTDLTDVTSMATYPPYLDNKNVFTQSTYDNAKLSVPESALDSYKTDEKWSLFKNIGNVTTSIGSINEDGTTQEPVEYYNIEGMRISQPAPGSICIRRQGVNVAKISVK